MPFDVTMPQLGLTMESGKIVKWLVAVGESVTHGQPIFEVETDKSVVVVEAAQAGTVAKIGVAEGEDAPVGAVVAVLAAEGESPKAPESPFISSSAPSAGLEATWKARAEAHKLGIDLKSVVGTGPGGRVVAADVARPAAVKVEPAASPPAKASPVAAKLAASLQLNLAEIAGSGPQGRIMEEDVLRAAAALIRGEAAASAPIPIPVPARAAEIVSLTGVRGIVSRRMAESAQATARVALFREVDAGAMMGLRKRFKEQGLDIGYNDILVRISAAALKAHPGANARLGQDGIELLPQINIGIAVDTARGLLVPVIRNADCLSIKEIAAESKRLIDVARSGHAAPDDLKGGTFTISNLGMLGVDGFTPIINLPECCILGVGRIVRKAVVCEDCDEVMARPMMTLSLVFDHRVIDGAPAARFLDTVAKFIEEPALLLV